MKKSFQRVPQKYFKYVFLILVVILVLLFDLTSKNPHLADSSLTSKEIHSADSNLTSDVINSVIVLDSYVVTRSGDSYGLHVLVKTNVNFIPIQIRLPDSGVTYRTTMLTPSPQQHCPFADRKTRDAGIIASLKRGEMLAYDSDPVSDSGFANAQIKLVDLVVEVRGELFLVNGIQVSGGCFWAQE